MRATARALLTLLDAGITTSQGLYAAQVKKAVEALIKLVARSPQVDAKVAELALGVAFLVATGGRTRKEIEGIIKKNAGLASTTSHMAAPSRFATSSPSTTSPTSIPSSARWQI